MKPDGCPNEMELLQAHRSGALPAALQAHAAGCTACGDALRTEVLLQSLVPDLAPPRDFPAASLLRLRAQLVSVAAAARAWRRFQIRLQAGLLTLFTLGVALALHVGSGRLPVPRSACLIGLIQAGLLPSLLFSALLLCGGLWSLHRVIEE